MAYKTEPIANQKIAPATWLIDPAEQRMSLKLLAVCALLQAGDLTLDDPKASSRLAERGVSISESELTKDLLDEYEALYKELERNATGRASGIGATDPETRIFHAATVDRILEGSGWRREGETLTGRALYVRGKDVLAFEAEPQSILERAAFDQDDQQPRMLAAHFLRGFKP